MVLELAHHFSAPSTSAARPFTKCACKEARDAHRPWKRAYPKPIEPTVTTNSAPHSRLPNSRLADGVLKA